MRTREVDWRIDETTVHGTVTLPEGAGPFPGVVLVAGSGPTDRDWNSPALPGTNGSARLLAEALAHAGFAAIRYDKRASGPHVRETMPFLIGRLSMRTHLDELDGAVSTLAALPEVDGARLFGLGNSEGVLHVLGRTVSGTAPAFAGLVLTGAPGRPVGALARTQLQEQLAKVPGAEEILHLYDEAIARFLAGEPAAPDTALPEGIRTFVASLEAPANLPFARELWTADGAALLGRVEVPVLVVIGRKDIQVDARLDGAPLERAAAGRDVRFVYPEDADHVLKYEPAPRAELAAADVGARYNADGRTLDPAALETILGWLRECAARLR